jgi:hypothetical protein
MNKLILVIAASLTLLSLGTLIVVSVAAIWGWMASSVLIKLALTALLTFFVALIVGTAVLPE